MQTDVSEAFEPAAPGPGGASTTPHKRNPTAAAAALAAATIAPNLLATIMAAQVQEHERALGGWQAEWPTFPRLRWWRPARHAIADIAQGLEVDGERMRVNLAERAARSWPRRCRSRSAPRSVNRRRARMVDEASRKAAAAERDLQEVLGEDASVKLNLTIGELAKLFEPMGYQGAAQPLIDRIVGSLQGRGGKR